MPENILPPSDGTHITSAEITYEEPAGYLGGFKAWKPIILTLLIILAVPFWLFCYLVFLAMKQDMITGDTIPQIVLPENTTAIQ